MALGPLVRDTFALGMFVEKEHGRFFEYDMASDYQSFELAGQMREFPHVVWVSSFIKPGIECGYRRALVKRTVAYIVVDEDENGPVIEKWYLKNNTPYFCADGVKTPGEKMFRALGA